MKKKNKNRFFWDASSGHSTNTNAF